MRRITEERKLRDKRGQGEGAEYTPWITAREFRNMGTGVLLRDWKSGRQVQLLSNGEEMAYYILRWDDHVVDIREQYPLDLETTVNIAHELGLKHPKDERTRMTTDLLVTYEDDHGCRSLKAYSVKPSWNALFGEQRTTEDRRRTERCIQIQSMEMEYWIRQNIPFKILFKDKMNSTLAANVRIVAAFYDLNDVNTKEDAIKYLIAHKRIKVDMENSPIAPRIAAMAQKASAEDLRKCLAADHKNPVQLPFPVVI